jgi:hypothetical protein
MAAIDWSELFEKYAGLWVALMEDEVTVITSGTTAKEVWNGAREKGFMKPILAHMPPNPRASYVGANHQVPL